MLDRHDRYTLLAIARHAIERTLNRRITTEPPLTESIALTERRASFVTLKYNGQLRGCIGTLEAIRKLCDDVAFNAHAAAFRDPRFPPLTEPETDDLRIEISILEKPVIMNVSGRQELLASLRPDSDGLIVEAGWRRATFLPSVWESLADPDDFVKHLWLKAGLAPDDWPPGIRLLRYGAEHFDECDTDLSG